MKNFLVVLVYFFSVTRNSILRNVTIDKLITQNFRLINRVHSRVHSFHNLICASRCTFTCKFKKNIKGSLTLYTQFLVHLHKYYIILILIVYMYTVYLADANILSRLNLQLLKTYVFQLTIRLIVILLSVSYSLQILQKFDSHE